METPLNFELPRHPEPVDAFRQWAMGLRGFSPRAGEHWEVPTDLEGVITFRVLVPSDEHFYEQALDVLVALNLWCLRAARNRMLPPFTGPIPPLYQSICYGDEGEHEVWSTTYALYLRGHGDCEDLACARVAERQAGHDYCLPDFELVSSVDGDLFHVFVRNPDNSIEDPSQILGMVPGLGPTRCSQRKF